MRASVVALALAACAAAPPPAPLPTPPTIAHLAPDAAPAPIASTPAATACLHDADATDISLLQGDAHTIDVCFTTNSCFTIDRRTHAITKIATPTVLPPPPVPRHPLPISVGDTRGEYVEVCTTTTECKTVERRDVGLLAGGRADIRTIMPSNMIVTIGGTGASAPRFLRVNHLDVTPLPLGTGLPCADATWLDENILVTSDDCNGGAGSGVLYDLDGKRLAQLGTDRALDAHDVTWRRRDETLAIVAPRAYALVLTDAHWRSQSIIDLIPIQVESTPTPRFEVTQLDQQDWLVASATGGIGIVDHTTATLAKTWIIPHCEASP